MPDSLPINYAPDGMALGSFTQLSQAAINLFIPAPPPDHISPEPIPAACSRWEFRPERISGLCAGG